MTVTAGDAAGSALYGAAIGAAAGAIVPGTPNRPGAAGVGALWGAGAGVASYLVNSEAVRCQGQACTPWIMMGTLATGAIAAMATHPHERQRAAVWGAVAAVPVVIIFGPMINAILGGTGLQRPQPASAADQPIGPAISYAGVWRALRIKPGWA